MRQRTKKGEKDFLLLIGTTVLIGIGIPVFFLAHSRAPSPIIITDIPSATSTVPFTKLTQGTQSVIGKRVNYILRSSTELSELWKTVSAPGAPPNINFKTHAVIAVFAGKQSGASIAVAKIIDSNKRLVSVAIAKPDGPCPQIVPNTSPYQIVAVPSTSLPLAHEDFSTTASCK